MSDQITAEETPAATPSDARPWVLSREPGPWFDTVPGEAMRIRVHGKDVGGRFTITESIVQPQAGPPMHTHREDEVIAVQEGTLVFVVGGDRFEADEGTIVVIPAGVEHAWRNVSDRPARTTATFTPGGIDELLSTFGQLPAEALPEYAARYGSIITGPPIAE